jgi:hypothetical protein
MRHERADRHGNLVDGLLHEVCSCSRKPHQTRVEEGDNPDALSTNDEWDSAQRPQSLFYALELGSKFILARQIVADSFLLVLERSTVLAVLPIE